MPQALGSFANLYRSLVVHAQNNVTPRAESPIIDANPARMAGAAKPEAEVVAGARTVTTGATMPVEPWSNSHARGL